MKFKADTSMTIAGYTGHSEEIDTVITAQFFAPDTIEILRVEAYDPKTKTLHILHEFMVDMLTGNEATKDWLREEAAHVIATARAKSRASQPLISEEA